MRLPDVPDPGQVSFAPRPIVAAFDAGGDWHDPGDGKFAKPGWSTAKGLAVSYVKGLLAREHARDKPDGVLLALRPDAPADLRGRINSADGTVLARYKDDRHAVITDIHKRSVLVPWDRFEDPEPARVEVAGQHKLPFRAARKPKIQPLGEPSDSRHLSAAAIRSNRRKNPEMNALWERLTEDEFQHLGVHWLPPGTVHYDNGGYRSVVSDYQNWAMDQARALDQTGRDDLGVVDADADRWSAAPRWFLDAILAMDDYTGPDNWVSKGGGADRVELVLDRRNDPSVLHPARPEDRAEIKKLIEPLLPNGKVAIFSPVRRDVAEGAAAALAELPEADRRHVRFFTFGYETELRWAGASATPAWWSIGTKLNPKVVAPGMHIDMNFNWSGQTDDWFEIRAAATKALRDEGKLGAVSLGTFEGITDPDARARLSVMHEVGHAVDFTAMSNGSVKDLVDQMQYDGRGGDIDSDALIDRRLDGVVTTPYGATTPLEAFAEAYAIHHSGIVPEAARPSLDRLRKAVERRSHQASEGMPIVNELADRPSEPVTGPTHLVDYFDGTHSPELVSLPHAGTDRGDAGPEGSRLVDEAAPGSDARSDRPAAPLNLDGYDAYKAAFRDGSIFDPKYAEALSRSALSPVDIPGAMIAAYGGFIGGDVNVRGFARLIAEEFGREDRLRMVDEVPRDDPTRDWETIDKIFAGIGSDARFDGKDVPVPDRSEARRMVRAVYEHTQEHLASLGYHPDDRVLLYRGLSGPAYTEWNGAGRADHLDSPPFTAFAHDPEVAIRYSDRESGGIVTVEARVGDIFSIGLKHDYEAVMLAPTGEPGFHVVGFSEPRNVDEFYDRWPTREAFLADNPGGRPEGNYGSFVTGYQHPQDPERIVVRAGGPVSAGIAWADNNGIFTPDTIDAPGLAPGASFEELARRSAEAVADRLYPRPGSTPAPIVNEIVDPLALAALADDPVVSKITTAYADAGHPVYVVGGAIRSVLQGQAPNDIDLTTPALPAESTEILDKVGTVFPLGEKFGTVVVNIDGMDYEVTTHRTEVYDEDSRKPVTQFTTSLADDLARRDFTFNAMALDTDGTLIDPFGGQEDLAAGVVRAVGDADERFSEDPLRTIRAVRFAAVNGFSIDPDTAAAARRQAHRLNIVSRERFGSELDKIMKAKRPGTFADAVHLADDLGVTEYLFGPLAPAARRLADGTDPGWSNLDNVPPEHRLAALVMASGIRPATLVDPMKRGRVEMRDIADSIDALDMLAADDPRRAIRAHTDEALDRARGVTRWADEALAVDWPNRDKLRAPLPINGNDLLAAGLTGRDIRTALEAVETLFLARNGEITHEEAMAAALAAVA